MSADTFREQYTSLVEGMCELNGVVNAKLKELEEKERHRYSRMRGRVDLTQSIAHTKVGLNVGGQIFAASRDVFLRFENTYFHVLLQSPSWGPGKDGAYFIDRDPTFFNCIMESLRSGRPVDCTGLSLEQVEKLRVELDYYQMPTQPHFPMRWDATNCAKELTISEWGSTITHVAVTKNWHDGSVLATTPDAPSFKVRINDARGNFALGFAFNSWDDAERLAHKGCFLRNDGSVWNEGLWENWNLILGQGDVVNVKMDTAASIATFAINGTNRSLGCERLSTTDCPIFPCVIFWGVVGTSLSLLQ